VRGMQRSIAGVVPALVVLALTVVGCATRAPHIGDIRHDPGRYYDRRVTVDGTVTTAWRVPLVDLGVYKIEDGSGEVTVVSRARHTPARGSRVRVTGVVRDVANLGQPIGLHIQERDVDVLR
jgi:hypothetical protein